MQVLAKECVQEATFLHAGLPYTGEDWKQIHFRIHIENGEGHLFKQTHIQSSLHFSLLIAELLLLYAKKSIWAAS